MLNTVRACTSWWQAIVSEAKAEDRELTTSENHELNLVMARLQEIKFSGDTSASGLQLDSELFAVPKTPASTFAYFDSKRQKWVRDVAANEPLCAGADERVSSGPRLGDLIKGKVTGNWRGLEAEHAAVQQSDDASGGFVIPSVTMDGFIDRARSKMVMMQAGARTIQLPPAESFSIGRLTGDVTVSWRREATAITSSVPTFDKITMYPRTAAILVPVHSRMAGRLRQLVPRCLQAALRSRVGVVA